MGQPISGRTPCFVRLRLEHQHCFCSYPLCLAFSLPYHFFLSSLRERQKSELTQPISVPIRSKLPG